MSYIEQTMGYDDVDGRYTDVAERFGFDESDNFRAARPQRMSARGRGGNSQQAAFTGRMARILDVPEREIPTIFVNKPTKAVRTNPLQAEGASIADQTDDLFETLDKSGIDADELDWFEGAALFDASHTRDVQDSPAVHSGRAFIQNPSSYLPVMALDVRPGDSVLDMCAAPGGKTSLIAAIGDNRVDIIANEPKDHRRTRMERLLRTLGVDHLTVSNADGNHLPSLFGTESFDKVLVDAECSTEAGVNFESKEPLKDWSVDRIRRMHQLQKKLITAGYDLLKPGGVLVYSTCTLSPEENESVLAALLQRRTDAEIQPLTFDAEPTIPGMRRWEGQKFSSEIASGVLRVMPGDYMEGFFVSRIRKPDSANDSSENNDVVLSLDEIAKQGVYRWTRPAR